MAERGGEGPIPRKLTFSNDADRDLEGIAAYSTEHWDRAQALKYRALLQSALNRIAVFPGSGVTFVARPAFKSVKAGQHRMFYHLEADGSILIVRILDARMDADRHLP